MSKQYGKRVPQVKAIVATMQKFIDSQDDEVIREIEEEQTDEEVYNG
jgi:hypothetical protein